VETDGAEAVAGWDVDLARSRSSGLSDLSASTAHVGAGEAALAAASMVARCGDGGSCPGGRQLRHAPAAVFQQSEHVYCRQSRQKWKVDWNPSVEDTSVVSGSFERLPNRPRLGRPPSGLDSGSVKV
jgi:hypothetical protein